MPLRLSRDFGSLHCIQLSLTVMLSWGLEKLFPDFQVNWGLFVSRKQIYLLLQMWSEAGVLSKLSEMGFYIDLCQLVSIKGQPLDDPAIIILIGNIINSFLLQTTIEYLLYQPPTTTTTTTATSIAAANRFCLQLQTPCVSYSHCCPKLMICSDFHGSAASEWFRRHGVTVGEVPQLTRPP